MSTAFFWQSPLQPPQLLKNAQTIPLYKNKLEDPLILSKKAMRQVESVAAQLEKFGSLAMRLLAHGAGARSLPGPCQ
jgi:hypothetical protein